MRFGVLGPLAVWTADGRPVRIPEVKVRALLADLIAHRGQPVSTDRLIEDVWGSRPPGRPAEALRVKVSQLRRALAQAEPDARDLVVFQPPGYALRVDADAVDVDRFRALTDRARSARDLRPRVALLTEALALWRGPAFADFRDEQFAQPHVSRLEELRLVILEEQAEARLELGEHGSLAGELAALVAAHPLRERLQAVQIEALYRAGRQSEALSSYRELSDRLREELGLDPGPRLVTLYRAILAQDPALSSPVAAAAPAPPRTNLPEPLTPLIGRAEAVEQVRALLAEHRLVTLTGSGGVGKTRLALHTAGQAGAAYPDGVWLVDLGPLDPPAASGVVDAVTAVLGLRDDADAGPRPASALARLAEALRGKEMMLLLDNCEHVIEAVASTAQALLQAAPGLRILATSQEPLGIVGETQYTVLPLDVPAESAGRAALEGSSAGQLFTARAAAAVPGYILSDADAEPVAAICRRLDGIPLALELAATRMRVLSPAQLAARLDDRFHLLSTGRRGAPARHQTLRAMIDWSWELLTEAERVVLRRLAVYADGCTLSAAEVVCAGHGVHPREVLDLLARLIDRSLVVAVPGAGGLRYRLLESVAAYCVERLAEAGELDQVRHRHVLHYAEFAETAATGLRGREQRRSLEVLDAESANLRAALKVAGDQGDAASALRVANALIWYWILRGRLEEGRRVLGAALSVPGDVPAGDRVMAMAGQAAMTMLLGDDPVAMADARQVLAEAAAVEDPGRRAWMQWLLGYAQWGFGDLNASAELVDRALATFSEIGDRWGIAAALGTRAVHALVRGDLEALERDGRRSADLFAELGDGWGRLQATGPLATFAEVAGRYDEAAALRADGLRIAEDLKLWVEASHKLAGLGRIALLNGDYDLADALHHAAQRLAAEQASRPARQFAEVGLALSARRQGQLDVAEKYLLAWLDWMRVMEAEPGAALLLAELGFVAELRGDAARALELHRQGFAAARATADPRAVALALEGLAGALTCGGEHELAARLLGAAAAARQSAGAPLPRAERGDVDRITAAARGALGEAAFDRAALQGAASTPDELFALVDPGLR